MDKKYIDLNEIVWDYKVSKPQPEKKLRKLKKLLSKVPVFVKGFDVSRQENTVGMRDIMAMAELSDPETGAHLLGNNFSRKELDEIYTDMETEHVVISLCGIIMGDEFHKEHRVEDIVLPRDGARLLRDQNHNAVGLLYRPKGKDKKLQYIEIWLVDKLG